MSHIAKETVYEPHYHYRSTHTTKEITVYYFDGGSCFRVPNFYKHYEWSKEFYISTQADMKSAGTFEIIATGADAGDNYTITYVPDMLTAEAHTEHSGGVATCIEKAICALSNQPYGETLHHTYSTYWKHDGTNHWHECSCGAKSDEATHNDGTATCENEAVCTACDRSYGELAAHTYENGKCTVCSEVDPNRVPETSSPRTGDDSNLWIWVVLLFVSGGAVITLTVIDRKRRAVANK